MDTLSCWHAFNSPVWRVVVVVVVVLPGLPPQPTEWMTTWWLPTYCVVMRRRWLWFVNAVILWETGKPAGLFLRWVPFCSVKWKEMQNLGTGAGDGRDGQGARDRGSRVHGDGDERGTLGTGRAGQGLEWEWAADGAKNCEQGRWDMPARNALSINLNQYSL